MLDMIHAYTLIAMLICCLGLFGLATFTAEQRTKEIGIRKVLGASVTSITGLLAQDFLKLVALALVIASPLAYFFMQKWLSDFAYRIQMKWWMCRGGRFGPCGGFFDHWFSIRKSGFGEPRNLAEE